MTQNWPQIRLLDQTVANQIAAGEVVERPASVVKELLENSLDAGATRVQIRLTDGGRQRMEVVDNGHGMDLASAQLAFARHATSKLTTAQDLLNIGTFGFRGEALASILSVAQVSMTTRRSDMDLGVQLQGGGNQPLQHQPAPCQVGTQLVITDLFFNVPARLKFLRTAPTELGQVLKFVDAVALARPDVHLTVWHNERKICDYPVDSDLHRRAFAVLGKDIAARLHPVADDDAYQVRGMLSDPGLSHLGPSQFTCLVNGRPVSDKTLQHAVLQAYGALLERGRYPIGVLQLQCPAETLDVNVHPAKTEVRFVAGQTVFAAVNRAVRAMLAQTPWMTPSLAAAAVRYGDDNAPVATKRNYAAGVADHHPRSDNWLPQRQGGPMPAWRPPQPRFADALDLQDYMPDPTADEDQLDLHYIGQAGLRYLLCQSADSLVVIEQHPAHECILLQQFHGSLQNGALAGQRLLMPTSVVLSPAELELLQEQSALLQQLGFDLELAGEQTLRVRAQPAALRGRDIAPVLRALAQRLCAQPPTAAAAARTAAAAATLACHAAVRQGDALTQQEAVALLRGLSSLDPAKCVAHGRAAVIRSKFEEIGRWFQRI